MRATPCTVWYIAADGATTASADRPEGPKQRLLSRAIDHVSQHGLGDQSLRQLAEALGTSHRMLIYHFGSKEGLLVEIVRETERRQLVAFADLAADPSASLLESARMFWQRVTSPDLAPLERLFFEVYALALQGRSFTGSFLEGIVDSWIEPTATLLRADGVPAPEALAEARLGLAVVRGLLLDLLATGDIEGVNAAHELYLQRQVARSA